MNSAISTDRSSLPRTTARPARVDPQPGFPVLHFFAVAAPMAATVTVMLSHDPVAARLIVTSLSIGAAALVGLAVYRMLGPFVTGETEGRTALTDAHERDATAREKLLVLRSIKELEFDRSMGKVSAADADEMLERLRGRAIDLMRLLQEDPATSRTLARASLGPDSRE